MARLTVKQCKFCPIGKENCDYFKSLKAEIDPIAKGFAFSHDCKRFWKLFKEGDRVEVGTALAYENVENSDGYTIYPKVDTVNIKTTGVLLGNICKDGKVLVLFDDKDNAMDIVRAQIKNKVGFYGRILEENGQEAVNAKINEVGPAFRVFVRDLKKI